MSFASLALGTLTVSLSMLTLGWILDHARRPAGHAIPKALLRDPARPRATHWMKG